MIRIACLAVLLIACSDRTQSAPKPAEGSAAEPVAGSATGSANTGSAGSADSASQLANSPVYGWWDIPDVDAAEDVRGGAMKLGPDRLAIVTKEGRAALRTCKTTVSGRSTLEVTITGCGPDTTAKIVDQKLEFAQGFTATRTAPDNIAKLDAMVASRNDTCERARACYRLAWPMLGRALDEATDFGPAPTADTCADMLAGVGKQLVAASKKVPASCAP